MTNRYFPELGLVILLAAGLLAGCSKTPDSRLQTPDPRPQTQDLVAKLHWLGKKRLAAESNATNFMAIWSLPESAKLEAQMLDRLSTAPWRLLKTATALSNAPVALLRPLLDDLVQEESYLEVRAATNQPGELVLAIRLNSARAALWQTNLAAVLESLTGVRSTTSELRLKTSDFSLALSRSGSWTLLALSDSRLKTQDLGLLADFQSRIPRDGAPFPARATNYWLEAQGDLPRVRDAFALNWRWIESTPQFSFTMVGEGENVRTRGTLDLSRPLAVPLEPWRIPTNLIGKALTSFTAARGLAPWLESSKQYADLQIGPAPNQLFVWSLPALPMQTFLAVPIGQGDDRFSRVQQRLLAAGNQWLATNSIGQFVGVEGNPGVEWQGAPFMTPFVRPVSSAGGGFMTMGLIPTPLTNVTGNVELAARVLARTNAVYYDWEFTGPRIESWFHMGQLFRVIFGRGQIPQDAAVTVWLRVLQPRLSNSGTVVTLVEPPHLSFERLSTVGFTAIELHLLADWLESPQFPLGLHTTQVAMKRKLSAMPVGPQAVPSKP